MVALRASPRPDAAQLAAFGRVSASLEAELCASTTADDFNFTRSPSFWCRIVCSVDAGQHRLWGTTDLRDRAGGDNVKWLLDHRFAGKKVVLWMHSFHGINGQAFPRACSSCRRRGRSSRRRSVIRCCRERAHYGATATAGAGRARTA